MNHQQPSPKAALWFLENLVLVHLDGDESDGRWDLIEFWARPGDQPPPHVHKRHDEAFYVTAGEVTLFLPDRELVMGPGQFFNSPQGVPHTYRVTADIETRWLVSASPAGIAAFVRDYGHPAEELRLPDPEPPDIERLAAAAAKGGMELLGPPGMLPSELPESVLAAYAGRG